MSTVSASRFDPHALRQQAGETIFARGKDYFARGLVRILDIDPRRVLAEVSGTEIYRTSVTGAGAAISGKCSCPAAEDWGFCKHMVAVALAADATPASDEPGAFAGIRAHLMAQGAEKLAEMVLQIAEHDMALLAKLELAAAIDQEDDKAIEKRLGKAINHATRTGGHIDYYNIGGWVDGVETVLDAVGQIASGARAHVAIKLVERAIERIEEAIESIDDSNGEGTELLARAQEIHLAAVTVARPDPGELARNLFEREMTSDFDTFTNAAARYAQALGEAGLAEYRRLAADAWAKLPAQRRGAPEYDSDAHRLWPILDFFAERDGDVDARIALRAKDLSAPHNYVRLVEFCLSAGREDEALQRAEEGLWAFEDGGPDEHLALLAANLLAKSGRKDAATERLWSAFRKAPSLALYEAIRKLLDKEACARAIEILESARQAKRKNLWVHAIPDLIVNIRMREGEFDAAWDAARQYNASFHMLRDLAKASEKARPRDALDVYARQVENLAGAGGASYAEAVKVIRHMGTLRDAAEQAAYVLALKERHGRKRNFMKLLA